MRKLRDVSRFKRNVLSELTQIKEEQKQRQQIKVTIRRINVVNEMLKSLKKTGMYDESVAVDNLFSYLSANTINVKATEKRGLVSKAGISVKSLTSLTGINKAIDQFLKNPTSTVKGMKQLYANRKDELGEYISDKDFIDSLGYDDLKTIYSVFQSNEYERTSRSFDSKSFFTLYTQAIDEKWNKNRFMQEAEHYMEFGNDETLKEDISKIYENYVENYVDR